MSIRTWLVSPIPGVGTSTVSFLRTLEGAAGVAAFGAAVDTQIRAEITGKLPSTSPDLSRLLGTPRQIDQLTAPVQAVVREAFSAGMHLDFLLGVPTAALEVLCALLIPEPTSE